MLPVPTKGSYISFPGEAFEQPSGMELHMKHHGRTQKENLSHKTLISHEQGYLGLHASVSKVCALLDIVLCDEGSSRPILYLHK